MPAIKIQKHMREALAQLPGWTVERITGSTHYQLRHAATGATMTMGASPGCWRFMHHTIRTAKRAIREAQERRA
jgi:predicted RNA binding protein YcfA (HicA-like mRNA interferase family)